MDLSAIYIGPKPRYITRYCTSWLVTKGYGFADFDSLSSGILTRCIVEVAQQRATFRRFAGQIQVRFAGNDTSLWSVITDRSLDIALRDRTSHALVRLWDQAVDAHRSRVASNRAARDVARRDARLAEHIATHGSVEAWWKARRFRWEAGMARWRAKQAATKPKPKPKPKGRQWTKLPPGKLKRPGTHNSFRIPGYTYGPRRHGKGRPKD